MTFDQAALVVILLAMMAAYASERVRVEIVAMSGLGLAFAIGIVDSTRLFTGFSSPAVITVVEVLLVSAALAQTRLMDGIARRIVVSGAGERTVIMLICAIGGGVSVFINNIGALALMFPIATSVCSRLRIAPGRVLMPLSFSTLLGGMCSLTGTPANLVVNEWMAHETGGNLGYFETGLFGFPMLVIGIGLLAFLAPKLFPGWEGGPEIEGEAGSGPFTVERIVAQGSALAGQRLTAWEEHDGLTVHCVIRHGAHVFARRRDIVLAEGDLVVVEGPLPRLIELEEGEQLARETLAPDDDADVTLEFVVMPESLLVGSRVEDVVHYAASGVSVQALASRRGRIEGRFGEIQISTGDVLLLGGEREDLRLLAAECGLLMLTPRRRLRPNRKGIAGAAIFAAGVLATAFNILPPEAAFGAVVLAMAATRQINLRTALQEMNWTIVILLACMIPLGQAVENTGTASLVADSIADWLPGGAPMVVAIAMLLVAVLITPFIDNVSTAAILSPIAAGLASRTGTSPEILLLMVAVGASIDFLTPFGHHNNTVVMGAGNYRFRDFARLGLPLTVSCIAVAGLVLPFL